MAPKTKKRENRQAEDDPDKRIGGLLLLLVLLLKSTPLQVLRGMHSILVRAFGNHEKSEQGGRIAQKKM